MKKILFILTVFLLGCVPACKKEEPKIEDTKPVSIMRNIKYEASVINSSCLEINYDGTNYLNAVNLSWDYSFQKEVGVSLALSGRHCDYISSGEIILSIYQEGQLIKTIRGDGWQYLNYIVK